MTRILASTAVSCCGQQHRVGLLSNGKFRFFNHNVQELNGLRAMVELGLERCGCLRIADTTDWPYSSTVAPSKFLVVAPRFKEAYLQLRHKMGIVELRRKLAVVAPGNRKKLAKKGDEVDFPRYIRPQPQPKPVNSSEAYFSQVDEHVPTYLIRTEINGLTKLTKHRRYKYRGPSHSRTCAGARKFGRVGYQPKFCNRQLTRH